MCVYVCFLDTFNQCPEISVVFVQSVFLSNWNSSTVGNENVFLCVFFFFWEGWGLGMGWSVCTRWIGLYVIAEKMKIYSYQNVVKNPYAQDDS